VPYCPLTFSRRIHPKNTPTQRVEKTYEASTTCRDRRCGRYAYVHVCGGSQARASSSTGVLLQDGSRTPTRCERRARK
jgi:hypothetical protein